ncbi:MAG: signal peptidase II [bacterium]|nr:signal peptidase II [bacterium]
MSRRIILSLISAAIVVALFALDALFKWVASYTATWFYWWGGQIQQIHHQNYGLLANVPAPQWVIVTVTVAIIAGLSVLLVRSLKRGEPWETFFLSILLAGALGNLFDRILLGYVRDWILLFHRSAINFADVYVTVGGIGYVIVLARKKEIAPV